MPTMNYLSEELTQLSTNNFRPLEPRQARGRIRVFTGFFRNTTGSTIPVDQWIGLCDVPPGYLLPTSRIYWSAFGATATMKLGHDSYKKMDGTNVVENQTFFRSALDISSASSTDFGTFSRKGYIFDGQWRLIAQPQVVAIPVNAEIHAVLNVVID